MKAINMSVSSEEERSRTLYATTLQRNATVSVVVIADEQRKEKYRNKSL